MSKLEQNLASERRAFDLLLSHIGDIGLGQAVPVERAHSGLSVSQLGALLSCRSRSRACTKWREHD
jgi:hypothetical protein